MLCRATEPGTNQKGTLKHQCHPYPADPNKTDGRNRWHFPEGLDYECMEGRDMIKLELKAAF